MSVATPIDINALIGDITKAATDQIGKDLTTLAGFSQIQVEGLARQAQLIAGALASGHLSDADRDFFLSDLKRTARDFANVLVGLALVDIEKVWNSAVTTLWDAIGTAAQVALPKPF
jgi:hypothetical protein